MLKTPLRYPGGKSKALWSIIPQIPDFSEYREPFLGGGSVFLALKQQYPDRKYWVNDLNDSLWCFWTSMQTNSDELVAKIQHAKDTETDGRKLYLELRDASFSDEVQEAVRFFVMNRITFSGITDAGAYSQESFDKRFTQSSIDRLLPVADVLQNTRITNLDYTRLLLPDGKDVFVYLDPPYYLMSKSKLYGKTGMLHATFDHVRLARTLREVQHKWFLTYDDCSEIRNLYKFANVVPWSHQYSMNNPGRSTIPRSNELFISNF